MRPYRICLCSCILASLAVSAQNQGAPASEVNPPIVEYTRAPDAANVAYGPHERNVLDLWKAKSDRPAPLVSHLENICAAPWLCFSSAAEWR
jgi:hypothetical protein